MEGPGAKDNKGVAAAVAKITDKSKRDEWSEGGVLALLDSYQDKWVLRNRAKLKGSDWDDIARKVSSRDNGKKSVKSPNQCKNKIEAMKKRYRAESAISNHTAPGHLWHFFPRMDQLLKGKDVVSNGARERVILQAPQNLMEDLENDAKNVDVDNHDSQANGPPADEARNGKVTEKHALGHVLENNQDDGSNTGPENSEFSTPYNPEENVGDGFPKMKPVKRRKSVRSDVAESIRMLAHSMLKIEQARMDMCRDSERLRAEAEIKRAEMDLKRTEIVAKTQLQIAKLFAAQQTAEKKSCKHCCLPFYHYLVLSES